MPELPLIVEPDTGEPDFATVMVDATIAGRPYRLVLDTGAARTQLNADEYTSSLHPGSGGASSAASNRSATGPIVTVTDVVIGPLRRVELDVSRTEHGRRNTLGMDLLGHYRCHFQLGAGVVELETPSGVRGGHALARGPRGDVYVDVRWPGVTGQARWDTGSGRTIVDRDFWLSHPDLFEHAGASDGNGAPLLLMAGPVIGGREFSPHKAVAVDLSRVKAAVDHPIDLILGYPTIRQADWLFDFPDGRWMLTSSHRPGPAGRSHLRPVPADDLDD
jgi:Aspartyl protease